MTPEKAKPNQLPMGRREEIIESMAEMVRAYVSGDHFEDRLHRMTCDALGLNTSYTPVFPHDYQLSDVEEGFQTLYYNTYALIQAKVLARAIASM